MAHGKRERRRHPRAITNFVADVTMAGDRYVTRVINLSMGGALLDFRREGMRQPEIAVGTRLTVNIRCRGGAGAFVTEGKAVLWNQQTAGGPLLAVQFDEITGEAADVLEELLAEALAEIGGRSPAWRASVT
ncbi:MAG: PilZ domain-containing protein [Pseudomonadota bacterium]